MNMIKIEKSGKYTYVKCNQCNKVLITNDSSYFLDKVSEKQLHALASCEHFLTVDVHKDPKSLAHLSEYEKQSITKFENSKYIIFVIPRKL